MIILDIDHFKNVNDEFGHNTGDMVLQEFASILLRNCRETDIIGRWGGEEFLIVAPNTKKESLSYFANNLKEAAESHQFENIGNLTASLGVTVYHVKEPLNNTIARADEALYISKNSGRNQVTLK
ncbi:MAG: GGDEF domain-containing protein [Campylobacterota bacterium]|nr:GGDEF domain-containing protein [Campylobacterota bacterium]